MLSFSRIGSSKLPTAAHSQLRFIRQSTRSVFQCQQSQKHSSPSFIQRASNPQNAPFLRGLVKPQQSARSGNQWRSQKKTPFLNALRQYHGYSQERAQIQFLKWERESRGIVLVIIAICCGVSGWHFYQQNEYASGQTRASQKALIQFNQHMVLSQHNINEGRWYTMVTSAFAHSGIFHLGFNMLALYSFGPHLALVYGIPRFLAVYLGSAAAGSYAQLKWEEMNHRKSGESRSIGASGAICGILGATAGAMPYQSIAMVIPIPMPIRVGVSVLAIGSIASLQQGWLPWIGHADHLGGLAFGLVSWLVLLRRGRLHLLH